MAAKNLLGRIDVRNKEIVDKNPVSDAAN